MIQTYHVFLCAGLGNRLFQYASVKGFAKLNNVNFNVIGQEPVGVHNNNSYEWFMKLINSTNYQTTSFPNMKHHFQYHKMSVYEQPEKEHIGYHFIDLSKIEQTDHILFQGCYQSEEYFENIADELREELKEPAIITPHINTYIDYLKSKEITLENSCLLHMRLKDKLGDPRHFVHYGKYYERTIDIVLEKNPNTTFLILSETPQQINDIYPTVLPYITNKNAKFIFVSRGIVNPMDCFDFYFITRISTIISTCSTFVWWAAWLNLNPEKQIYLPSRFLNDPVNNCVHMKGAIIIDVD